VIFNKCKAYFKEKSPDWVFAIFQMIYWGLHPKYPFIKMYPMRNCWVAIWNGERFCSPTPRTGILAHFVGSYRKIYGRHFWVEENETVLDIGAYAGSFALEAAKSAKKVIAIEPNPKTYDCLLANVRGLDNIQTVNLGVWKSKGKLQLYLDQHCPLANSIVNQTGSSSIDIDVDSIDSMLHSFGFGAVDFVKINVEGAELEVLQGMEGALKSVKKLVMDAHHVRDGSPTWPAVCKFLEDRGFQTWVDMEIENVYAWRNEITVI
jgi:FkbM family methyltransferase